MLNVRNEGTEAFEFQMLLHTYWKVEVRCHYRVVEAKASGLSIGGGIEIVECSSILTQYNRTSPAQQ